MDMEKFWKEISLAYSLVGIRQRGEKYLCDQATSGQSQTLIHVLGIRQFLLQSILLSLQPIVVSKASFTEPLSALISTVFNCCAHYVQKQAEYSSPLQKNCKAFFNEREKKNLNLKKCHIFYSGPLELQFPLDMNPEKSWLNGQMDRW